MTATDGSIGKDGKSERPVAVWLLTVAFLVFAMVLIGGATRLMHAGLSMVEWRPLIGALPPMNEADWAALFAKYRQFPEYQKLNQGMTLAAFKEIFLFEYVHRLMGRLIGLAFALPMLFFLFSGRLRRRRVGPVIGLFLAGGAQGLIGWWMVKSGLVDRPDVSHYRLTIHLGLAIAIFGALIWFALDMLLGPGSRRVGRRGLIELITLVIFLQMLLGAMVAGLDAGLIYNSFPRMGGNWLPADIWVLVPGWRNLLENPATLQFAHRLGAVLASLLVLLFWWRARTNGAGPVRRTAHLLVLLVLAQFLLGVLTLLYAVPVGLGVAHQGFALLLFGAAVGTARLLK